MKTYLCRASKLKSTITFLASVSWWKSVFQWLGYKNLVLCTIEEGVAITCIPHADGTWPPHVNLIS